MRLLTTLILLTLWLTAIGQTSPTKKESGFRIDSLFAKNDKQKKLTSYYYGHLDTEIEYTDSTGNSVITVTRRMLKPSYNFALDPLRLVHTIGDRF